MIFSLFFESHSPVYIKIASHKEEVVGAVGRPSTDNPANAAAMMWNAAAWPYYCWPQPTDICALGQDHQSTSAAGYWPQAGGMSSNGLEALTVATSSSSTSNGRAGHSSTSPSRQRNGTRTSSESVDKTDQANNKRLYDSQQSANNFLCPTTNNYVKNMMSVAAAASWRVTDSSL